MEPLEFGKFIVQFITWLGARCAFCTECKQGQAVIKKRFGYPIKWRTKARWYWKWPFVDMFDKVDMRKRYAQFNAHSFYDTKHSNGIMVPYNILIDFQIEYQIVNPLVICEASGYMEGEDIIQSYIGNTIHSRLSELIRGKVDRLSYGEVVSYLNGVQASLCVEKYSCDGELRFDDSFSNRTRKEFNVSDCVSINSIVVTSFDRNVSLRTTI